MLFCPVSHPMKGKSFTYLLCLLFFFFFCQAFQVSRDTYGTWVCNIILVLSRRFVLNVLLFVVGKSWFLVVVVVVVVANCTKCVSCEVLESRHIEGWRKGWRDAVMQITLLLKKDNEQEK